MSFITVIALLASCAALSSAADTLSELPVETVLEKPSTSAAEPAPAKVPEQLETTLERPFIDGVPQEVAGEADCQPRICHRIYKPICGVIDGVQITAPSRCEFNNKARCAARARGVDQAPPEIRILHSGPC